MVECERVAGGRWLWLSVGGRWEVECERVAVGGGCAGV